MGSEHENYITQKYNTPVFLTHWPIKIKSFYMKQCNDQNETCESFDLLMPYGIGELIGSSMREDDYDKIEPLPNLDFKIVQGNSLLETFENFKLGDSIFEDQIGRLDKLNAS
jgi:hypothetical protein